MRYIAFVVLAVFGLPSSATDIASCTGPSGFAYYPEIWLATEKNSGWTKTEIGGGITKLSKHSDGEYDIQFVDVRNEIISTRDTGGKIIRLSKESDAISVLVVYPDAGKVEVFTFIRTKPGNLEYLYTTSRSMLIVGASVMKGHCDYINFDDF